MTKHPARLIALGVLLVVVAFGVVLALNVTSGPNLDRGELVGKAAPPFELVDLNGEAISLGTLQSKTVFVNFWNEWCLPCKQEEPALKEFYERHKDDPDFAMVGIVRDSFLDDDELRALVDERNIGWTILSDPKSKAALAYGTTGQPESFMISPSGIVAGTQYSAADVDDLEAMLRGARRCCMTAKRWLPWIALGAIVVISIVVLVARSQPSNSPEARANRLEHQIGCPVCTGESVAGSNVPEARAASVDIRDRIAAGESDTEIKQAYIDAYGEDTMLNPSGRGLGIFVWGLPVLALICGAAGLFVALRRWSRTPRLEATDADEKLVRRARDGGAA